jgi:hypothetical protein
MSEPIPTMAAGQNPPRTPRRIDSAVTTPGGAEKAIPSKNAAASSFKGATYLRLMVLRQSLELQWHGVVSSFLEK